jgi:hypothetical protein
MPKDKISQYAFTPAANTDIGGINIDEGCAPSGINNAIRTLMTQIRDLQAGVSGDTVPLTAGGTGSGTAASARAALGLAIGTNVLGYVTPGASGNILLSDGSNWTSVAQSATITLDTITGGPLALAKGGTNATTAAQARTNLDAMQNYTAGATGQVLTSTGTGWISQAAASGGFTNMTVFASPGTFTTPATTTKIKVTVVGGGGGGNTTGGGGGGGGAIYVGPVTASTGYAVTIGGGGAGANVPTAGSGGTSSFGALASATGGGGGGGSPTGGVGTAGTLLVGGGGGGQGVAPGLRGLGGPSLLGGGGSNISGITAGRNYGGGGAGLGNGGGAGAGGVVVVEY